ncbi:hypothetical protein ACWGSK_13215 [Nocardiopsis sp. NPDC055551]
MSRLMHRTCDTTLAARESELRESTTRAARLEEALDTEIARGKRRLDQLAQSGDALLDSRINAQIERKAAAAREAALLEEIDSLQHRITDLEEEDTSREATLETRRRRVAEIALGGAWYGPGFESSPGRVQVAQALLALLLASYDVTVTYQRDGNSSWYWAIDGDPINPYRYSHSSATSSEEVLLRRYGFTDSELSQIRRDAEAAYRRMRTLTEDDF